MAGLSEKQQNGVKNCSNFAQKKRLILCLCYLDQKSYFVIWSWMVNFTKKFMSEISIFLRTEELFWSCVKVARIRHFFASFRLIVRVFSFSLKATQKSFFHLLLIFTQKFMFEVSNFSNDRRSFLDLPQKVRLA